jgi:putative ABC transport system permease protein
MMLLRLGLRNVIRQWRRNLLSIVSIVAGVFVLILGRGFVHGLNENILRAQIDSLSGHVMAVPADYPTFGIQNPVDHLLTLDHGTRAWLDDNAQAWTTRVLFVPRAIKGRDAMRIRVIGFDPERDEAVFPRDFWRVDGAVAARPDEILLSTGVSRILGVATGDTIVLEARTSAGAMNALEVKVSGVLTTSNPILDQLGAFAPMALVEALVQPQGSWSHLAVRLGDRVDADAVAAALRPRLSDARVTTYAQEAEDLTSVQELRQRMFDILALALMAISATGIANTVLMATYERVREIGTLQALGMTRRRLVALFVTEGLLLGVLGSALGALIGAATVHRYSVRGIDLSSWTAKAAEGGGYENVSFSTMLYLQSSAATVLAAFAFGLAVALLASLYPAVFASRLSPAESVRA